jgi:hypothetical protein
MPTPKYKRKAPKGFPVLRGTFIRERGANLLIVHCPHCDANHVHGWDPEDPRWHISHRCAHCGPGSPFTEKGYYVGLLPEIKVLKR